MYKLKIIMKKIFKWLIWNTIYNPYCKQIYKEEV